MCPQIFDKDHIRRQFVTDAIGLHQTTKCALPLMHITRWITHIYIGSLGGKMSFAPGSLCHGTQFLIEGPGKALSHQLDRFAST